ncbi:MAG TPA: ATP-binding protein [Limnobacter sp.]|uniref:sensor histidine kinase n=1 Tax=Limnobacter sp. TaxID=2003368 RepID=UPI002ED7BAD0
MSLLSAITGKRWVHPDETAMLQRQLSDTRQKLENTELLNQNLRTQLQDLNAAHTTHIQTLERRHQSAIDQANQSMRTLQGLHEQLTQSLDLETLRHLKENEALLNQLNWLSGTIAHDFRAPLRAIDAYSFFLADDLGSNVPPEAIKSLDEIRRNGQRMGVLLDGLIEYLRMSVCPLNLQSHDLTETVQQVINEHFDFSPVPISVEVRGLLKFDKPLVMRLFKELIDNAVKFSKGVPGAQVQIRQHGMDTIDIIDNGVGFDAAFNRQKFQLFHRMHGNDEFPGEGIGLAMAERIAARHHWQLSLSRLGERTVAQIQLSNHPAQQFQQTG